MNYSLYVGEASHLSPLPAQLATFEVTTSTQPNIIATHDSKEGIQAAYIGGGILALMAFGVLYAGRHGK